LSPRHQNNFLVLRYIHTTCLLLHCQLNLAPEKPTKVRFLDIKNLSSLSLVSTTPKQLTCPAIRPYHLSAATLPATRAGRPLLARLTHANQLSLTTKHYLPCKRKLYTPALYGGSPDDIIKLSDLAFANTIPEALPQLHSKSLSVPPSAKPQEKLSLGGSFLLDSEHYTTTSSPQPIKLLWCPRVVLTIIHCMLTNPMSKKNYQIVGQPRQMQQLTKMLAQNQQLLWCLELLVITTHTLITSCLSRITREASKQATYDYCQPR
jgi:hypothetical protein